MKLNTNIENPIIKMDGIESKLVSMEASPAAIQILTKKLYSNVPMAVIRELSTNAIDANRMVGEPLGNFTIHLPSKDEPFFSVEDNGVGMTKDEVMHVFTDFFKTTKSYDNQNAGMYGLGSKTPLAYTNVFNITSCKNGTKNNFVETWDGTSLPEVTLISSEPVDESVHGTKITVPVKESDIIDFNESFIYCSAFWPSVPELEGINNGKILVGNGSVDLETVKEYNQKFKKSIVSLSSNVIGYYGSKEDIVEMGYVGYDMNGLFRKDPVVKKIFIECFCVNYMNKLVIHADIGDIDVLPNREVIAETPKNIAFLKKWTINYASEQFIKFDNINDRLSHYCTNSMMRNIDLVKDNIQFLTPENKETFLDFYNIYKLDLQLLKATFSVSSFLTRTPVDELDYNNKPNPYPYVDNLSENYIKFATKPLRVMLKSQFFKGSIKKTLNGSVSGSSVRNVIKSFDDYRKYNYLITDDSTLENLNKSGISYTLIEPKTFVKDEQSLWDSEPKFELAVKMKDCAFSYAESGLISWVELNKKFNLSEHKIIPIIRAYGGYNLIFGDANRVKTDKNTIEASNSFSFLTEKIAKHFDGLMISGSRKDIYRLLERLPKENIFDYVAFARKMIFKKVDDFDKSKMPDSNNFFKKIHECPSLVEYINDIKWPESSNFIKAYELYKSTSNYDDTHDFVRNLTMFEDQFEWHLVSLMRLRGDEEASKYVNIVGDLDYRMSHSRIGAILAEYPLCKNNMIDGYERNSGFTSWHYVDRELQLKALIEYFALYDGAEKVN